MSSMMRKQGSFWKRNLMTSMKTRFINRQVWNKRNTKYDVDEAKYTFFISNYILFAILNSAGGFCIQNAWHASGNLDGGGIGE